MTLNIGIKGDGKKPPRLMPGVTYEESEEMDEIWEAVDVGTPIEIKP